MSDEARAKRIDRLFRLVLIALVLLWVILPPRPATPEANAAVTVSLTEPPR